MVELLVLGLRIVFNRLLIIAIIISIPFESKRE